MLQHMTLFFAATCPVGQVRFKFHLPYSIVHLPLKNCVFYVSFKTKENMVLVCESLFSWTSLDARPQNLHTFSEVNLKYIQLTCPVRPAQYSFHLPFTTIIYKFYLPWATGQAPMSSPVLEIDMLGVLKVDLARKMNTSAPKLLSS